jgi:hypothetical protein
MGNASPPVKSLPVESGREVATHWGVIRAKSSRFDVSYWLHEFIMYRSSFKNSAAEKEAAEIKAAARAEANKTTNDAKVEAAAALRKREAESKEMREKLRAIVG